MAQQLSVVYVKKSLLEVLDETFDDTHGIYLDKGTSLFQTLESVTAAEASQAISPNTATIAAQAEHVRFYLDVLTDVMITKKVAKVDWREIWNSVTTVTPNEWNDLKRRLRASHQRVLSTIDSFEDWQGEYDFDGVVAVLTHTAYHLGGIRQALAALRTSA